LGHVRPTSVGNIGSIKKRDKNKSLIAEINAAKPKNLHNGEPLMSIISGQNHN